MKKYLVCFISLFSFIVLNTIIVLNIYNNKNNVFRLHVISNSNTPTDLIEKLKVNENIKSYIENLNLNKLNSKQDIENTIYKNLDKILNIANDTLKNDNITYIATAKYGKIHYQEKENLSLSMNEGIYDSLQIILGNGNGENIWSLIFPNENDIKNISNYETIIPGISKLYSSNTTNNNEYESFIFNSLKKCLEKISRH